MGLMLSSLLAGSGGIAELPTTITILDIDASGPVSGGVELRSDGTIWEIRLAQGDSQIGTWLVSGAAADFECIWDTPGTPDTGTVDTWLSLSSNRTWSEDRATSGSENVTGTLRIRNASTGAVIASTNASGVSLTAEIS